MSWSEYISGFVVSDVMAWTGVPMRTVYSWREGKEPPSWVQAILRERIEARLADAPEAVGQV